MRLRAASATVFAVLATGFVVNACGQGSPGSAASNRRTTASSTRETTTASKQEKIAALRELRDSGVISEQEYNQKIAALQAGSSAGAPEAGRFSWPGERKVEADDPVYQMTAYTLDVPATWKYAGVVPGAPVAMPAGRG